MEESKKTLAAQMAERVDPEKYQKFAAAFGTKPKEDDTGLMAALKDRIKRATQ